MLQYEPLVITSQPCKSPQGDPCSLNVDDARHGGKIDKRKVHGYLIEIMEVLSNKLNFRVDLRSLPSHEATFGIDEGEGNFSGLVGYLQRKEADVALSALQMTKERAIVMDFTGAIAFSSYCLYIRSNATKQNIGWKTYVRSFQWTAWLAILLLLFVASVCLWVSVTRFQDEDPHFKKGANVTFILFSCIVQQGSWILPRTVRTQAILWLFWVASVILYASYTARLTSYLTVSTTRFPFTSLGGAVSAPGWRITLQRGTSVLNYIRRSTAGVYGTIHEGIKNDPGLIVDDNYVGLHRILTEDYLVLLAEDVAMRYLINNCSVVQIPGSYLSGYLHTGLRKHLPYSGVINKELNKMSAGGILDRISKQWWTQTIPCSEPSAYTELGFTNILTAFLLLIAGCVMSLIFLLIELCQKDRSFLYSLSDCPADLVTKLHPYSKPEKT
ncbi:glutamate receptor ionotropic, kainate glr-3-like isoform X2 [Macrobrachium rosenbergii]|uniref:glutamate receptor ionotropic, kainate glr-3-like isoform X2 n=1 Tax=Macrobrachium rosenbergii TaxID=79674 RepID=UPI0034D5DEB2